MQTTVHSQYGLNGGFIRNSPMDRLDQHQDVELNYLEQGRLSYQIAADLVEVRPNTLLLFWSMLPHRVTEVHDAVGVSIHIPTPAFLKWNLPKSLYRSVLAGRPVLISSSRLARVDAALFRLWSEDLSGPLRDSDRLKQQLLREIEVRLQRVDESETLAISDRIGTVPEVVTDMARLIAERCTEPDLSAHDVAEAVGLHPKYAMSLFGQHMGVTLHRFIVQHRLALAQQLLATTDLTVLAVAMESGFQTVSRFYAQFKSSTGRSPNDFRKQFAGPPRSTIRNGEASTTRH